MSTIQSFFAPSFKLPDSEIKHITKVLHYSVGQQLQLVDGAGSSQIVTITSLFPFTYQINESYYEKREQKEIILIQSLIKGARFDQAIEAGVELGVSKIVPYQANRSIVKWHTKKEAKELLKLKNLVISSSKQCRRLWFPKVSELVNSSQLFKLLKTEISNTSDKTDMQIVLMYEHSNNLLTKSLNNILSARRIYVIVGPEGGITDEEYREFKNLGAVDYSLGSKILRSATATTATLALLSI